KRDRRMAFLRLKLAGASNDAVISGEEELESKTHYFIGNDPTQWHTNISNFRKVRYQAVYPGVDLVFYGNQRQLEFDFEVSPGANPRRIEMQFEGADKMEVDENGDLILHIPSGQIRQHRPIVYQKINGVRRDLNGH